MDFFRQGEMDGLCGFYATLNAVWGLRSSFPDAEIPSDRRAFFDGAVIQLARVGGVGITILQGNSDVGGIDQFQIEELVKRLVQYWRFPSETFQLHEINPDEVSLLSFLNQQNRLNVPFALVCGRANGGHWATVYKTEAGTFELVDPSGAQYDGLIGGRTGKRPNHLSGVLIRGF